LSNEKFDEKIEICVFSPLTSGIIQVHAGIRGLGNLIFNVCQKWRICDRNTDIGEDQFRGIVRNGPNSVDRRARPSNTKFSRSLRGYPDQMRDVNRVVVFGGAGFVGGHLCERLLSRGAQVVCVALPS
jgi:hypothetical protein